MMRIKRLEELRKRYCKRTQIFAVIAIVALGMSVVCAIYSTERIALGTMVLIAITAIIGCLYNNIKRVVTIHRMNELEKSFIYNKIPSKKV